MTMRSAPAWKRDLAWLMLLAAAAAALYGHTLNAPFYMDDYPAIVDNPQARHPLPALQALLDRRGVATLSFALNYRFGGLDLPGYHLVNIALHLCCAWLVYLLLKRIFPGRPFFPGLGAMLFIAHPLQTQAVTYVVQRMTSLCALLFLLSLYLYARARERLAAGGSFRCPVHLTFYLLSLATAALAVYTKEIALVLPAALLLFERFFLPGDRPWRTVLLYLLPFCAVPLVFFAQHLLLPLMAGETLLAVSNTEKLVSLQGNSPVRYLVTEFSVLWIYLRLLFLPYGQALDHGYPVVKSLLSLKSLAGFLGLAGLGWFAFVLRKREPPVAFGIAWFFLALAVESSIIPLDPLFEHRLYLPMFGFVVLLLGLATKVPGRQATLVGLCALVLCYGVLTWQRNQLWNDPVALYEDNLRRAPQVERIHVNLAVAYLDRGRLPEAEALLRRALALNPNLDDIYVNLSKIFFRQAYQQSLSDSLAVLQEGMRRNPDSEKIYNNIAGVYLKIRDFDKAIQYLNQALALNPHYAQAYTNLGAAYAGLNRWEEAERYHRRAIEESPEYASAHYNLGMALHARGKLAEALEEFRVATRLEPDNVDPLYNAVVVAFEMGDAQMTDALLARLKALNPTEAAELERKFREARR